MCKRNGSVDGASEDCANYKVFCKGRMLYQGEVGERESVCAERTSGRTCQVRGWALTQRWALGREEVNHPFAVAKK